MKVIRIVSPIYPPFIQPCAAQCFDVDILQCKSCSKPGVTVDFFRRIAKAFVHRGIQFTLIQSQSYGSGEPSEVGSAFHMMSEGNSL